MGYRCERCEHEWLPRLGFERDPRVCPKCKSPYWDRPRHKPLLAYEDFRERIAEALRKADKPTTWTELRTAARLPQAFPNNQWVHRMEADIGLQRRKDSHGIILWSLKS